MNVDLTGDLKLNTQHTAQSDLAQERVEARKGDLRVKNKPRQRTDKALCG